MYSGVVSGIADIGISCFSYTRGRFPVLEVFELPGITYLNSKVSGKVAWEGIKQLNPEEVQDTHLLMVFSTGPGHLLTRVPIRNLEDLKGVEIRATGLSAKTLQTLGAVPVAMAQPETYEALSRGIVKGNLSPSEVLQGWRHAEVTSYTTITPFLYNTLFFMTFNLDTWNSLSPKLQKAISEANERIFEEVALGLWDDQNDTALNWAINEKGMQKIELSPSETRRWIDQVVSIQNEYIEKMNAMGLDGKEILNTVKELADKYNQEYGED
jgi:TRAP-type C4-dicarboxylate transport system substrate-binding protein